MSALEISSSINVASSVPDLEDILVFKV